MVRVSTTVDVRSVISCVEEFVAIVVTLLLVVVIGRLSDAELVAELCKVPDDDSTGELDLLDEGPLEEGVSEGAGPDIEELDDGNFELIAPSEEELDGRPPEDVLFPAEALEDDRAEGSADELGPLGEEPLEIVAPDDGEFELAELEGDPSDVILLAIGGLGDGVPENVELKGELGQPAVEGPEDRGLGSEALDESSKGDMVLEGNTDPGAVTFDDGIGQPEDSRPEDEGSEDGGTPEDSGPDMEGLGDVSPVVVMLDGRAPGDVEFHELGLLGDGQPEDGRLEDGTSEEESSIGLFLMLVLDSQPDCTIVSLCHGPCTRRRPGSC